MPLASHMIPRGRDLDIEAPKEQPPRKLSGKRTARGMNFWKAAQPWNAHRRGNPASHF